MCIFKWVAGTRHPWCVRVFSFTVQFALRVSIWTLISYYAPSSPVAAWYPFSGKFTESQDAPVLLKRIGWVRKATMMLKRRCGFGLSVNRHLERYVDRFRPMWVGIRMMSMMVVVIISPHKVLRMVDIFVFLQAYSFFLSCATSFLTPKGQGSPPDSVHLAFACRRRWTGLTSRSVGVWVIWWLRSGPLSTFFC